MRGLLRLALLPWGITHRGPRDEQARLSAALLLEPSAERARLTEGLCRPRPGDALHHLHEAFRLAVAVEPLRQKLKSEGLDDPLRAHQEGVFSAEEMAMWRAMEDAAAQAIAVDDFAPEDIRRSASIPSTHG